MRMVKLGHAGQIGDLSQKALARVQLPGNVEVAECAGEADRAGENSGGGGAGRGVRSARTVAR